MLTAFARLARSITGASSAAVHIFDESHERRIAAVGARLGDSPEEDSLCRLVVRTGTRIVTSDAVADGRFNYSSRITDPVTPVRFFASVPLQVAGGVTVGTICAFDTESRGLSEDQTARLEDIAQLISSHLELVSMAGGPGEAARLDPLTGAVNRTILEDRLSLALARHRRHGTPTLVAVIDLDDFKALNDTFGRDRGDAALQFVARNLLDSIREEDTVGRLGGDEFAVIAEAGGGKFGRLHELFRHAADGFDPRLGVSVGAVIARDEDDVESILRRADQAIRAAKQERRRFRELE